MSRVYKQIVTACKECPSYQFGICKIQQRNTEAESIPSWCTLTRLKRSKQQNNYYWGVVIEILANEFGYTKDEMHDTIKFIFMREEIPGKPIHVKSTTELDTKETEELYEKIRIWSATNYGIYIPLPNETA